MLDTFTHPSSSSSKVHRYTHEAHTPVRTQRTLEKRLLYYCIEELNYDHTTSLPTSKVGGRTEQYFAPYPLPPFLPGPRNLNRATITIHFS